jgi:hypothetical protein
MKGEKLGSSRCGSVMRRVMRLHHVGVTNCEGCVVRLLAKRLELQISILPGKGGYSTRPSGTTGVLVILVES